MEVAYSTPDAQRESEAMEEEAEAVAVAVVPTKKKKLALKAQGLNKKKKKVGSSKRVTATPSTSVIPSNRAPHPKSRRMQ
jgi:hypothetical protein